MLTRFIKRLDDWQQRHHLPAFTYAVIKKYGEDSAGYHAALLTYYGFLSLFPLLLIVTTVTSLLIGNNPALEQTIIDGLTDYFPLLGAQLSVHVHELHSGGWVLLAGILFTLYGTHGVADAWRRGVQRIWRIPRRQREGFPKGQIKSLGIVMIGGLGFILASISAGLAAAAGRGLAFAVLSVGVNLFILFWVFTFLIKFSLPRHVALKETRVGAAVAAVGLLVLQALGGYILAHELKSLDALYSYFALALGLLFWIYLQAQMLYYAVEIAAVSSQKLWPRSLQIATPTPVDKRITPPENEI